MEHRYKYINKLTPISLLIKSILGKTMILAFSAYISVENSAVTLFKLHAVYFIS
jgi:hypothetical protein